MTWGSGETYSLSGEAEDLPVVHVSVPITLGQFLKVAGLVMTGGQAKHLVSTGRVKVNGQVETRRGRKLLPGDVVESENWQARVGVRESPQG